MSFSLLTKLGNYIKWDLCQSMPFSRHLQGACLQRFLSFSESFILVHICFNCLTKARTNCKCCPIYTVKVYNVIGINENNIPSSTSLIQHPRTRCLLCIIHLFCMEYISIDLRVYKWIRFDKLMCIACVSGPVMQNVCLNLIWPKLIKNKEIAIK